MFLRVKVSHTEDKIMYSKNNGSHGSEAGIRLLTPNSKNGH